MTRLLDTHTVLWFWWNDPHVSATAMKSICDQKNRKSVSPATAWEVAIKVSLKNARHRCAVSRILSAANASQ